MLLISFYFSGHNVMEVIVVAVGVAVQLNRPHPIPLPIATSFTPFPACIPAICSERSVFLSAVLGFRACLRPVWTQSLGLKLCSARTRTCNHWIQSPPPCQLDHGRKHLLEYRLWCFSPNLPGANVCRPFGWSAVSASCLLAAWLFGGSGGG